MNHNTATKLREKIARFGFVGTVAVDGLAQKSYAVTVTIGKTPIVFETSAEWESFEAEVLAIEKERFRKELLSQRRTPIEMMIDRACGLE